MPFQDTILPAFVLADLYANSLISDIMIPDAKATQKETSKSPTISAPENPSPTYRFLGKNEKKVSVIMRYPGDPYIPEDHLQLLIKILSACKLNLGDVAILNDAVLKVEFSRLKEALEPAFVLLFDIEPSEIGLPLSFPGLKPQGYDGCKFLVIPAIETLMVDTEAALTTKKLLWDALKKMFAVER